MVNMHTVVCRYNEHHLRTSCSSSPTRPLTTWNDSSTIQRCPAAPTISASPGSAACVKVRGFQVFGMPGAGR